MGFDPGPRTRLGVWTGNEIRWTRRCHARIAQSESRRQSPGDSHDDAGGSPARNRIPVPRCGSRCSKETERAGAPVSGPSFQGSISVTSKPGIAMKNGVVR